MTILDLRGRLALDVDDSLALDVATASAGRFGPDPQSIYEYRDEFVDWPASVASGGAQGEPFDPAQVGPPVPRPAQYSLDKSFRCAGRQLPDPGPGHGTHVRTGVRRRRGRPQAVKEES